MKSKKQEKNRNQRQIFWAAKVDFNTHDIYLRQKRTRPSIAEKHIDTPSPATGNIYGRTEAEVLNALGRLYRAHIERAEEMHRQLKRYDIPAVYTDNKQDGRWIVQNEPA